MPLARLAGRVIAIDSQTGMLEKASKYAAKNNVKIEFYQNGGESIPLSDSIADLIFLRLVFHELGDKQAVLKELTRLLKRGGRLVIMEKTKSRLAPIGPSRVEVSEIVNAMQNVGLAVSDKIGMRNQTIVLRKR
jgi:ubiquinone/menaquinone biosynthesis C-methylase UbiE